MMEIAHCGVRMFPAVQHCKKLEAVALPGVSINALQRNTFGVYCELVMGEILGGDARRPSGDRISSGQLN